MADKYKLLVIVALFVPAISMLLSLNLGTISIVGAAVVGFFVFNNEFINKKDIPRTPSVRLGPKEAYADTRGSWPPVDWEIGDDGKPVAKPMAPRRLT